MLPLPKRDTIARRASDLQRQVLPVKACGPVMPRIQRKRHVVFENIFSGTQL